MNEYCILTNVLNRYLGNEGYTTLIIDTIFTNFHPYYQLVTINTLDI